MLSILLKEKTLKSFDSETDNARERVRFLTFPYLNVQLTKKSWGVIYTLFKLLIVQSIYFRLNNTLFA